MPPVRAVSGDGTASWAFQLALELCRLRPRFTEFRGQSVGLFGESRVLLLEILYLSFKAGFDLLQTRNLFL